MCTVESSTSEDPLEQYNWWLEWGMKLYLLLIVSCSIHTIQQSSDNDIPLGKTDVKLRTIQELPMWWHLCDVRCSLGVMWRQIPTTTYISVCADKWIRFLIVYSTREGPCAEGFPIFRSDIERIYHLRGCNPGIVQGHATRCCTFHPVL